MKSWLSMHSTQNRPIPPARRERVDIDRQNLLVTIPAERLQFGALLARLDRIARPHVIHATAGKDRTGWAAGLLLAVADGPLDAIIQDARQKTGDEPREGSVNRCSVGRSASLGLPGQARER